MHRAPGNSHCVLPSLPESIPAVAAVAPSVVAMEAACGSSSYGDLVPLDAFVVTPTSPASLLCDGEGWTIASLPLGPERAGALLVADEGSAVDIRLHSQAQIVAYA